jgi:hypothetical protein
MKSEMMVKKVTVMRNDWMRKQERLGYRFGPLVVLTRCKGKGID